MAHSLIAIALSALPTAAWAASGNTSPSGDRTTAYTMLFAVLWVIVGGALYVRRSLRTGYVYNRSLTADRRTSPATYWTALVFQIIFGLVIASVVATAAIYMLLRR